MLEQFVTIGDGGRVVIPSAHRKMLNCNVGDELIIRVEDGELKLFPQAQALKKIRATLKARLKKPKKGQSYTDEFIQFRRQFSAE